MRPLALAVCPQFPQSCPDDAPLLAALRAEDVEARCVPWAAPVDWAGFGGVLVRATWDYYRQPEAFRAWIDGLERAGVPTWNPPSVLRWNMDKHYLGELALRGVPTVPTHVVPQGAALPLAQLMDKLGWEEVVVKPAISAGAWETRRVPRAQAEGAQAHFAGLLGRGAALVQPFVAAVGERGEWSLVFLDGAFSHAALKRPGAGDFRVQEKHGGTVGRAEPPKELVRQAQDVLAHAPGELVYARVDGVEVDGQLVLMELEALEPELFFRLQPGSAERLARALRARLAR